MKFLVSFFVLCCAVASADAATGRARVSMTSQMMAAPRGVPAKMPSTNTGSLAVTPEVMQPADKVDMREDERNACNANNVGVGNTFVWASRYSDTNNYATMIEDTESPENNTCFVRVELKSRDPKVDVSDFESKYYEMGKNIKCGEWLDEEEMRQTILDAKKSKRAWATVGGTVGGAAVGVGAMELFGNKLIGGKVEGQKDKRLTNADLQIVAYNNMSATEQADFKNQVMDLKKFCDKVKQDVNDTDCADYKDELKEISNDMYDIACDPYEHLFEFFKEK